MFCFICIPLPLLSNCPFLFCWKYSDRKGKFSFDAFIMNNKVRLYLYRYTTLDYTTPHSMFPEIHAVIMVAPELSRLGRGKTKVGNRQAGMPTLYYTTLHYRCTTLHTTPLYAKLHQNIFFSLSKDPRYMVPQN